MSLVRITHVGGPTVLIEAAGWRLLTDPTFDPPGGRYRFGWGTASRTAAGVRWAPMESRWSSRPDPPPAPRRHTPAVPARTVMLPALAARARVSERHLARLFARELGTTPQVERGAGGRVDTLVVASA